MGMMTGAEWWRRAALLLAAAAVAAALGSGPARADDDDDGGGGGSAGAAGAAGGAPGGSPSGEGDGSTGARRFDLGPNPGRIPMPPAWERRLERLFGANPPPRPAPPARADLVALGLAPEALARLRQRGFVPVASRDAAGLVRLQGPAGLGPAAALARLRSLAPGAIAARNDRYRLARDEAGTAETAAEAAPAPHSGPAAICGEAGGPLVALIDTGVDASHPELAGRIAHQETLRGPGRRPARTAHGTAVALRLAGAAPGLRIAVLDAFHLGPDGEAADAFDIAAALARIGQTGARLANVSFVGPANEVVDRLGARAAAEGVVFVAAAGNDGPRARPLYPAAYPWTVAVSAVDAQGRPWPRSAAGSHIVFAAHGVELRLQPAAAAPPRRWSGTSFAAPLVTAAIAALPGTGEDLVGRLAAQARDAGAPGRDPVFGWGIVEPPACSAQVAAGG